jgi:hypothetical protein
MVLNARNICHNFHVHSKYTVDNYEKCLVFIRFSGPEVKLYELISICSDLLYLHPLNRLKL